MSARAVFREILKYLGAYLLGIITSIALTPVRMDMGGHVSLWFLYPILAPLGFLLFYFYLEGAYLPFGGKGLIYWFFFTVGLMPISEFGAGFPHSGAGFNQVCARRISGISRRSMYLLSRNA